jgi:prepilin-type processing-associated H-X9-DG protein
MPRFGPNKFVDFYGSGATADLLASPWFCVDEPGMPCAWTSARAQAFAGSRGLHPGGVNTLLGDGSVRFLKESINHPIWIALNTISGSEVLSSSDYRDTEQEPHVSRPGHVHHRSGPAQPAALENPEDSQSGLEPLRPSGRQPGAAISPVPLWPVTRTVASRSATRPIALGRRSLIRPHHPAPRSCRVASSGRSDGPPGCPVGQGMALPPKDQSGPW